MRKYLALGAVLALIVSGCAASASAADQKSRPTVVAGAFPIFDVIGDLAGGHVHAVDLSPEDPSAALTPEKAATLRGASLAIILGHGTQPALEKVAAERKGPTIHLLDSIDTKPIAAGRQPIVAGGQQIAAGRQSTGVDPNIWLNPQKMASVVDQVRVALENLRPSDAASTSKNAKVYGRMLARVDRSFAGTLATCKRKELLTEDPSFQYLTDRYGLKQVGFTPDQLRPIVNQYKPTTVFMSALPSLNEARKIESDSGVRVATLDPVAWRSDQARRGGADYYTTMLLDLDAIASALDCSKP